MHKFYHLPIEALFTIIGDDTNRQYKKISDTRAIARTYPSDEWGTAQFPFRKDTEVFTLDVPPAHTWEEFHIEITHGDETEAYSKLEQERSDLTERFESELYRLVKKYQGQAGLTFFAHNSEGEISEW